MSRARGPLLLLLSGLAGAAAPAAHGDTVIADLSSHAIAITTGFTGTSVVLFGATDQPGDVVAVVRGPEHAATVWRKGKVAGIWVNTESVTFGNVPGFYAVAASKPLEEVVSPTAAALYKIGVANLKLEAKGAPGAERIREFTEALIEVERRAGVFSARHGKIAFLGDRLFRTTFTFPANIPTGSYLVEVFFVRDKQVVGGQTTPLVVSKVGIDAAVSDFAGRRALAYGAIAVITAVMAGWLASLPFRNS